MPRYVPVLASLLFATTAVLSSSAQAQIVATPNDANTVVTQTNNTFAITGGSQAGANLYHSFQQFGLNQGQVANFLSNSTIQNILARVTGGQASLINGQIQVTGGTANLYLMNPAGIVFGSGASLNVPGSFTATTANGIGIGDRWFNAAGTNDYANLVGTPNSFAFTTPQPGAIINAGNLAVGNGQSLMLLGGTVINTGTVAAPGGTVTVAAIPGETLVRVSQSGSLLSLDLPLENRTAINPAVTHPLSLPELLTGGNLGGATGVEVNNGVVRLTGSEVPIANGDVVTKGATAQTVTIAAANDLSLIESQIQATGNLNLLAQNRVQVRDSATAPTVIQAGGNLSMQGHEIDIFALNHAASGLTSGADMVLRAATAIRGDAHYSTGGSLRFEQLDGSTGNLFSLYDPIILAAGDVAIANYTGASLHILAGGGVTLGDVTITSGGSATETINLANTNLFNGTRTFASLAPITRADGTPLYVNVKPIVDGAGNIQRTPTLADQLIIDGRNATLDIRAGIDWSRLGGLPGNTSIPAPFPVATSLSQPSSANIQVSSIRVNGSPPQSGVPSQPGTILLTNQYVPNTALSSGTIQVTGAVPSDPGSSIVCFACGFRGDPLGAIAVDSRSSITIGNLISLTPAGDPSINPVGVNVDLKAVGNINTGHISAASFYTPATSVVLQSTTGNIQVSTITSGTNGIDVQAAGLFRATGVTFTSSVSSPISNPKVNSQPGTSLGDFLISRGITAPPNQTVVLFDSSFKNNVSLNARSTGDPTVITIRYGDGSRTLINETFRESPTSLFRVVVRGGNAAFYGGPQVSGRLLPVNDPYVIRNNSNGTYEAITPANFNGVVYRNALFTPLAVPVDASGLVGGISSGGGFNASIYSAVQGGIFPPVVVPQTNPEGGTTVSPGGVSNSNSGISTNSSLTSGSATAPATNSLSGTEAQVIQQNNQPDQALTCTARGSVAPSATNSRSPSGTSSSTPCNTTGNNAPILQILGD